MTAQVAPADPLDLELGGDAALSEKFAKKWKEHHTRHVWTGVVTAKKILIQSRFATAVTLVGFFAMILFAVLEAMTPYDGTVFLNMSLNMYLLLLVWSATLPQANPWQVKIMCVVPFWSGLSDLIIMTANGVHFDSISWILWIIVIVCFPLMFYRLMKSMSTAVRNSRSAEELNGIATTTSSKILGSLPILFYMLLGVVQAVAAVPRLDAKICKLFVNSTNTSAGAWLNPDGKPKNKVVPTGVWENCSPDDMNVPDPVRTVHDINLRNAILQRSESFAAFIIKLFQAIEISILFITGAVLTLVRHKTTKDILAMRVSGAELALVILTGIRLMLDAYSGSLSLKNMTAEVYWDRMRISQLSWIVLVIVAFILEIYLVVISIRAQKKIKREVKETRKRLSLVGSGTTQVSGEDISKWN